MSSGIKPKQQNDKFFTVEFFGVTIILSSLILLVCLLFGKNVLFEIGVEVQAFLLGVFGYFSYPLLISSATLGVMMLLGKKPSVKSYKAVIVACLYLVLILSLLTVITNLKTPNSIEEYLSNAYASGRLGVSGVVAGGWLFSIIAFAPAKYLTYVGGIVFFSVLIIFLTVYVYKNKSKLVLEKAEIPAQTSTQQTSVAVETPTQPAQQFISNANSNFSSVQNQNFSQPNVPPQERRGYFDQNGYFNLNPNYQEQPSPIYPQNRAPMFADKEKHDKTMEILYGNQYGNAFNNQNQVGNVQNYGGYNGQTQTSQNFGGYNAQGFNQNGGVSNPIKFNDIAPVSVEEDFSPEFDRIITSETNAVQNEISETKSVNDNLALSNEEIAQDSVSSDDTVVEDTDFAPEEETIENETVEIEEETVEETIETQTFEEETTEETIEAESVLEDDVNQKYLIENMPKNYRYKKPMLSLFDTVDNSANSYQYEVFKGEVSSKIVATLKTFGVDCKIARVFHGPAVTRFDIDFPPEIPIQKVTQRYKDLNLRIAAKSDVRMIAPVPGTSYIGIEVPNVEVDKVAIRDIISSDKFLNSPTSSLCFAFGKDVIGNPITVDIAEAPHMLISGTTGSGKSVCLNALILSLITRYTPDELRFIIVDPKKVELEPFLDVPHMYFNEIIDKIEVCNAMLTWAVEEMERRFAVFSPVKVKNIKGYNAIMSARGEKIMPRLVIVMDEFSDFMLRDSKGIGTKVCLIAQKARAAGIHLVLAAQRPSVDIVEGPLKSNLPTRLVFRASSTHDSMVSLGEVGAEKLLGHGDCLYKTGGMMNVERVMGAYVSDEELARVLQYIVENNVGYYDYNAWSRIKAMVVPEATEDDHSSQGTSSAKKVINEKGYDPLVPKAIRIGFDLGGLSISMLQRKLAIGNPRAGKIVDWLADNGYIATVAQAGKRKMLITREQFEEEFASDEEETEE